MLKHITHVFHAQTRTLLVLLLLGAFATPAAADTVWIDVRTTDEYASDHIDGDANLPLADLDPELIAAQYGMDADIRLYCRSGGRAGQAMELLQAAGFTNVSNVGSINEVRDLREIVAGSPVVAPAAPGTFSAANR